MLKQIVLPLLGVIVFIALVGFYFQKGGSLNLPVPQGTTNPTSQKIVYITDRIIKVQVAKSQADRQKGLGGISSLDENSGMLFVFDSLKVTPGFWMKGMLIPLDIIWISDGHIVKIDKKVPAPVPGTDDSKLKIYSPGQPVDYVLEVNAGYSDKNGVYVGDPVDLSKAL